MKEECPILILASQIERLTEAMKTTPAVSVKPSMPTKCLGDKCQWYKSKCFSAEMEFDSTEFYGIKGVPKDEI